MNNVEDQNQLIDETVTLLNNKFQQLQNRQKNVETIVLYQPGNLPKANKYVMLARVEVEFALRLLVQKELNPETEKDLYKGYDSLLSTLSEGAILDDAFVEDIRDFYIYTAAFIREPIPHPTFLRLQYVSSDILERLHQILY